MSPYKMNLLLFFDRKLYEAKIFMKYSFKIKSSDYHLYKVDSKIPVFLFISKK